MKKFLISVFFACNLLCAHNALADNEADMAVLSTEEAAPGDDVTEITVPEMFNSFLTIGKYFHEKYPGLDIEKDFSAEVAKVFPELTLQEVYEREQNIRDAVKAYRYFSALYEDVKAKMLVPDAPPLVVDEDEYDKADNSRSYVDSDELVVVEDFKKVLSYGSNRRDFEAFAAKYQRDKEKASGKNDIQKLSGLLTKLEWKKLPYYGIIYEDPFTGSKGTGEWDADGKVKVRLIAEDSTLNNKSHFLGAVHFDLPEDEFIVAQKYQEYIKPQFDFSGSENLKKAKEYYPLPFRLLGSESKDTVVYKDNFAIPLEIDVEDVDKPLVLKAKVDFAVCDFEQKCRKVELNPVLKLESGEGFYSSVNNFIIQSFNNIPPDNNSGLKIEKAVIDEGNGNTQTLRIEFKVKETPTNFDIFVESDDNIEFYRPRIAIGDNKVIVRFNPIDKNVNLIDKSFVVTARLSLLEHLRQEITAHKASVFDYMPETLSIGVLLLAVLGGFILNFMPCVFPVLSIKLLSLTKFGANKSENVKKNFILTIAGIFIAFLIISSILALLKSIGYAIGWGMQFQNAVFLVFIIFIIGLFLSELWGWLNISTPSWMNKFLKSKQEEQGLLHFLTGVFVVVMATPCTAPYLGTAIGFALAGNIPDIFAVMTAVALGLSLPYILVILMHDAAALLPKPGKWMNRLNFIMGLMLFLTIIWLFSILYVQTDFWTSFRLGIYLFIFMLLLGFRKLLLDLLEVAGYEPYIKDGVEKLVRRTAFVLGIIIFAGAVWDIGWHFNHIQQERIENKAKQIDYDVISQKVKEGKIVVVSVGADWCLTCKYNDVMVFSTTAVEDVLKKNNAELIEVDWTGYNEEVLKFMEKYGRKGLPFYVVFSPMIPDGMVLPEVLSGREFSRIINNIGG